MVSFRYYLCIVSIPSGVAAGRPDQAGTASTHSTCGRPTTTCGVVFADWRVSGPQVYKSLLCSDLWEALVYIMSDIGSCPGATGAEATQVLSPSSSRYSCMHGNQVSPYFW